MNTLYYGDNLEVLRKYIADESVDLIYLDPPFNSQRAYNVIFNGQAGEQSAAQIQAFEDTWHWTPETQAAFDAIMTGDYPVSLKDMLRSFQQFMGAAFAPGALDVVQKELMTIALSVAVQCEPCLRIHLGKALAMGITVEEIQEAAWMGVAFGGCKAMMFWGEHSRSLGTNSPPGASK